MKINENLYKCDWCQTEIPYTKVKSSAQKGMPGRKGAVSNQLSCPKYQRYVTQK